MANIEDSQSTLDLLQRIENGADTTTVDELFDRHLPLIRASIQRRFRPRLNSRFDVSDVIQETHQIALQNLDDFLRRKPMRFSLWLLKTAHQRLVDLERKHLFAAKRAVDREIPLPDRSSMNLIASLAGGKSEPFAEIERQERAGIVRRCLAELNETDRQVLLLRVFDGLKNADIAAVLDITPDATKKRFARAIERLRVLLSKAGINDQ